MMRNRRREAALRSGPRLVRWLVAAACCTVVASCAEGPVVPPIPPPPPHANADLSGDFRLTAVGSAAPTEICVASLDPSHGTVRFETGALRFDTIAARVHMQHQFLHGYACSGSLVGTSSGVDIQRPIMQWGDSVFIRRPHPAGGEYVDTAFIRADTLFLRMGVPPLNGRGGPPLGRLVLRYVR